MYGVVMQHAIKALREQGKSQREIARATRSPVKIRGHRPSRWEGGAFAPLYYLCLAPAQWQRSCRFSPLGFGFGA